jgi:2-iminobutanoate/2-iminopropanoate deaminase
MAPSCHGALIVAAWSLVVGSGALVAQPRHLVPRKSIHVAGLKENPLQPPAILAGERLYISQQLDRNPLTGAQPPGIVARTREAMDNLGRVLRAAGMDFGNVVTCHVHLTSIDDYAGMNEAYGSYFGPDYYPARTTIALPALPDGASVGVSCIAFADKARIAALAPPAGTAPAPAHPFSAGVWAGDMLYLSGVGSRDPRTNAIAPTIEAQTKQTMATIEERLKTAGLEFRDSVFANVYFLDPDAYKGPVYGQLNSIYRDSFRLGTAPSRASFPVAALPGGVSVEFTFVASRDPKKGRVVPDSSGPSPTSSNGGVIASDTLYTSAKSGAGDTLDAQLRRSLDSILDILVIAGMTMEHVVDAHVYMQDVSKIASLNAVFEEYFKGRPPVRTIVQVSQHQFEQVQVIAVR